MIAPMIAGAQLAQSQQRINLEKQQLAAELAQLPLKQTLMQQKATLQGLTIEDKLRDQQNYLDGTTSFVNLKATVSPLLASGKLDDAITFTTQAGLDNNFLLTDPRYKSLTSQLDSMKREADIQEYRKGMIEARKDATVASNFRSKTMVERLELSAREAEANGDDEMAKYLRDQASLERDKLGVRKQELSERARRNDIRKEALDRNLNAGDRMAFASRLRSIEDAPRSQYPDEAAREAAREKALEEYEAKTKKRVDGEPKPAPATSSDTPPQQIGGYKVRVK